MKILFIHQNYPGQFKNLAPALASLGHEVRGLRLGGTKEFVWENTQVTPYAIARTNTSGIHPWVEDLESKAIRGEACFKKALDLRERGYNPDKIIAHHGWGESLFLKEVWPDSRLGIYCEYFYTAAGADVGFDPEFQSHEADNACRISFKNLNNLANMNLSDAALSPTHWQADTFPDWFRDKITVIHDGIDTGVLAPSLSVTAKMQNGPALTRSEEIITFVNRNLEPYRGYHIFMRCLPKVLRDRPTARVIIVGSDDISYGARPNADKYGTKSWKQIFLEEVKPDLRPEDLERIHFVGSVPYPTFIKIIQLSSVHVYLTYPFVLSWSLLEAMSVGCAIVAGDTQPVREVIKDQKTGILVDFFDPEKLSTAITKLLDNKRLRAELGQNARNHIIKNYDLKGICLPKQIAWVEDL